MFVFYCLKNTGGKTNYQQLIGTTFVLLLMYLKYSNGFIKFQYFNYKIPQYTHYQVLLYDMSLLYYQYR